MKLPEFVTRRVRALGLMISSSRPCDFSIGADSPGGSYLDRWWVIPRNRFFNVYLHRVHRSDDDRALHDHPWWNFSIILDGGYYEHTIAKGGIHKRQWLGAGSMKFRSGKAAHRLEVSETAAPGSCMTLFITGPNYRSWGFHCPESGWRHWKDFVDPDSKGNVGRGCGD